MSDLSGKTITIPADLLGSGQRWHPAKLRNYAARMRHSTGFTGAQGVLEYLADEIEKKYPPRMDEPDYGERVTANIGGGSVRAGMFVRVADPDPFGDYSGVRYEWVNVRTGGRYAWEGLFDVRPVE